MNPTDLPTLSIVIPTLNASGLLENCLQSVDRQTYARDRLEVLVADAHSTDATREVARRHGAVVLDDEGSNMEEGKRLALSHATGEYIAFLDADNELTHPDVLERAVRALAAHPQALGVESYYPPSPRMSSFCAYLTHLLHISDPMAWIMSANPVLVAREGEVERWRLPGDGLAYPLGANGFIFRKADLDRVQRETDLFQDTHVALHLMRSGQREWLRIAGRGVHHYYIQDLWSFLRKRRRAMAHYFNVRGQSSTTWTAKPAIPAWAAALYALSLVGPLCHTIRGWVRDRDWRWIWHVPATLASLAGILWGWQTQLANRHRKRLIAELQPRQTLKKE